MCLVLVLVMCLVLVVLHTVTPCGWDNAQKFWAQVWQGMCLENDCGINPHHRGLSYKGQAK